MKLHFACALFTAMAATAAGCSDDDPGEPAAQSATSSGSSSASSGPTTSSTGSGAAGGAGGSGGTGGGPGGGATADGWAIDLGDTAFAGAERVVVDSADSILVAGYFSATIEIGSTSLTSVSNGADTFLTKLDPAGNVVWALQLGTTIGYNRVELAVGPEDDLFMAGHFGGSFTLGGETFEAGTGNDVYAARWSKDGGLIWIERFACSDNSFVSSVAVDGAGGIVFGGLFRGTCDFGDFDLTAQLDDGYLVALDPTGVPSWSRRIGGAATGDRVDGVSIDDQGNVSVTGAFREATDFGDGAPVTPDGTYDLYLARYDGSGTHLSHQPIVWEGTDYLDGSLMVGDGAGDVVMAGQFLNITLDGTTHTGMEDDNQIFLAAFDSTDTLTVSAVFGELPDEDHVRGVALRGGSIALTGLSPSGDFGAGPLGGRGSSYVAVLSSTGGPIYSGRVADGDATGPEGVALDSQNHVVVVGGYAYDADFGYGVLDGGNAGSGFVLKRPLP